MAARRIVQIQNVCDACTIKGEDVEAVDAISVAGMKWDLCAGHAVKFARSLLEALGQPLAGDSEPEPEKPLGGVPGLVLEDGEEADFRDYCERIRDRRTGLEGDHKLDPFTQAAYAQYRRDAVKRAGICEAEGEHLRDWAENRYLDPDETATFIEFRGWLRAEFPEKAREYGSQHEDARQMRKLTVERNKAMAQSSAECAKTRKVKEREQHIRRALREVPKLKTENELIREWATGQGYEVNKRGPLPAKVREAYRRAHADEIKEGAAQ